MAITATDTFRGVQRVGRLKFLNLLAASPARHDAGVVYDYAVSRGVDALFLLAIFRHESNFGTAGWAAKTRSWGNTRPPSFGAAEIGAYQQDSGRFTAAPGPYEPRSLCAYRTWGDGGISTAARLVEHVYRDRDRIGEVFIHPSGLVWAPAGDANDPGGYLNSVLAFMDRHRDMEERASMARHIAIAAGHHHTNDYQGGRVLSNRAEFDFVGPLAGAIADALRRYPEHFRVTLLTPSNGLGIYPGGLWEVAAAGAALVPDMLIELHTQGLNDADQRGAFLIYPDWTVGGVHDKDTDAIAFAGVLLPALTAHAGIPQWRDGLMSETRTNVALVQQARLGFFNKSNTPAAREKTTRFLVEHLHHSNPAELARMRGEADLPQRIGRAYAAALASYYGLALPAAPDAGKAPVAPPEDPNALRLEVPGRGEFWIVEPILTYWENCGRVYDNPNALGWPVTGMVEEDGALIQYFDRGRVEVRGTQITSGLVGLEAARAAGKAA